MKNLKQSKEYNHKRLHQIFEEFSCFLGNQHCTYIEAVIGFSKIHQQIKDDQEQMRDLLGDCEVTEEDFQNQCGVTYKAISGKNIIPMQLYGGLSQGEIIERNKSGGLNEINLGQQTIVTLYAYWDGYLRFELSKAFGFLSENAANNKESKEIMNKLLVDDTWAELMYLRNSIVHYNGKANETLIDRTKVFTYFKKGDYIILPYEVIRRIFLQLAIFRNKIHELTFPPQTFRIPLPNS